MSRKKGFILFLILLICFSLTACEPSSEDLLKQAQAAIQAEQPDWDTAMNLIEQIPDQEMPGIQEIRDGYYFQLGYRCLFTDFDSHAAADAFSQCAEHAQADCFYEVSRCMSDNDLQGALTVISDILNQNISEHTAEEWIDILQRAVDSDVFLNMTLEERFALEGTIRDLCPVYATSLTSASVKIDERCKNYTYTPDPATSDFSNYIIESNDPINDLEEVCAGFDNETKILIVRLENHLGKRIPSRAIAFDLMRLLPPNYQPESMEEVNTILYLNYSYENVGVYVAGTGAIGPSTGIHLHGTKAYQLGVELWLKVPNDRYGKYKNSARYLIAENTDTIWGPNPPETLLDKNAEYYIADHPDIVTTLSGIFSTHIAFD